MRPAPSHSPTGETVALARAFGVIVCTRNRSQHLHPTLDALARLEGEDFRVVVVDQSDEPDEALARRAEASDRLSVIRDAGRGLSRARNLGWPALDTEWVVFVDDDCLLAPDWASELSAFLAAHPDASFVSGPVLEHNLPEDDYLVVTTFAVDEERRRAGRWVYPWKIGFGVCMAVRRSAIERLGGWDERLGAGVPDFPAAEDMDFNYRLLRAGGVAYATPGPRARHEQWRTAADLPPLFYGYALSWAGFAMKHLRSGDVLGGVWLWADGVRDVVKMFASSLRRRSRLRFAVAWAKLRGLVTGTARGLTRSW